MLKPTFAALLIAVVVDAQLCEITNVHDIPTLATAKRIDELSISGRTIGLQEAGHEVVNVYTNNALDIQFNHSGDVAISGNVMAVAIHTNVTFNETTGLFVLEDDYADLVRVYTRNKGSCTGDRCFDDAWVQRGPDLFLETAKWYMLSLNGPGNILAVRLRSGGLAVVYQYRGSAFQQLGNAIRGAQSEMVLAKSVVRIAVADIAFANVGRVQVLSYDIVNDAWMPEAEFLGRSTGNLFGNAISLSDNGQVLIAGTGIDTGGYVDIYKRKSGGTWELEHTLQSPARSDGFGSAVQISSDGRKIIVGAFSHDSNDKGNHGRVYIYQQQRVVVSSEWTLIGTFDGDNARDELGWSVAIDGDFLAAGTSGAAIDYARTATLECSPDDTAAPTTAEPTRAPVSVPTRRAPVTVPTSAQVQTLFPTLSPIAVKTNPSSSSSTPWTAIGGGIAGGFVLAVLLLLIAVRFCRKSPTATKPTDPLPTPIHNEQHSSSDTPIQAVADTVQADAVPDPSFLPNYKDNFHSVHQGPLGGSGEGFTPTDVEVPLAQAVAVAVPPPSAGLMVKNQAGPAASSRRGW